MGIGAWIYGRWARSEASRASCSPRSSPLAACGLPGRVPTPRRRGTGRDREAREIAWQPWSRRSSRSCAAGTPVFVDFTAAWCVTCQVNKRVALNRDEVVKALADRGVWR